MDSSAQSAHVFFHKVSSFVRNRSTCLRLLLCFLISTVFLGALVRPDYATDTYADVMLPASELIGNFLRGGRLITLLFFLLFRGLHIPIQFVNIFSFCTAICALTAALYILERTLHKNYIRNQIWSFILSVLLILNPFIIELFLFVEKGIMVLGVLACVVAAYFFQQYLDSRKTRSIIYSLIFVTLGTFCYQGVIGLFIVLATTFTIFKFKKWSTFLKDTALSVALYAIGPILNIIFIKVFSSGGRTDGEIILHESFLKILDGTKSLFGMFDIIPAACFLGCCAAILILWLIYCLKQRQLFQHLTLKTFAQMIYLFVVVYLAAIVPQALQNTASIWIVPRSTYVFASLFGVILTIILHNYPQLSTKSTWRAPIYLIIATLFCTQFYGFNRIIIDHYHLNALDRLRAEELYHLIREYEAKNNLTVTTIIPANDASITYSYPGLFVRGDINISAFATPWSDVSSINFWNQRRFIREAPDSTWQDYCATRDWSAFDEEQIHFSGETLQICWY